MKILVVHPRMSIKGGGERVAIHSILAGVKADHSVSLASEEFDAQDFEDFFGCKGLFDNVNLITYPRFKPRIGKGLLLYQRLGYHQKSLRKNLSRETRFDLVLGTQDIAYVPNVDVPVVQYCYFPEFFSHLELRPSSPLWRMYYGPAHRFYRNRAGRVARFLAVSEYTRAFVKARWDRDSETLYPPCPTDDYSSPGALKEELVVTVGRIVPEKRMHLFVEIARSLPEYKFVVIGTVGDSGSKYYGSLKNGAPENVSFVLAPLRKARDLLAASKVYVHCAMNEHFGITIVEAMAAGCVPVVHDSGGPKEIVSPNVGFRWKGNDEAVRQISQLMEDNSLRERLATAAAAKSSGFNPRNFESRLTSIFREYEN